MAVNGGSCDLELLAPPRDGISSARFSPYSNLLLSSSWDSSLYLYDTLANRLVASIPFDGALLDCCFADSDNIAFTSGLNCKVTRIDWNTLNYDIVGTHNEPVKGLVYVKGQGTSSSLLFSGSWDSKMTIWDPVNMRRVHQLNLPGKTYSMDTADGKVLVAMSDRHVQIYDIRKLSEPFQTRESSLRHQTRCVKFFPDAKSFSISSIEGRVGVEFVDPDEQHRNFAFKCHRAPHPVESNTEIVYPVNALAINPVSLNLFTGGSDGSVIAWNPFTKKRLRTYPKYPSSIASLSFSRDGSLIAVASSYCYEQGEMDHEPDSIFIRSVEQ